MAPPVRGSIEHPCTQVQYAIVSDPGKPTNLIIMIYHIPFDQAGSIRCHNHTLGIIEDSIGVGYIDPDGSAVSINAPEVSVDGVAGDAPVIRISDPDPRTIFIKIATRSMPVYMIARDSYIFFIPVCTDPSIKIRSSPGIIVGAPVLPNYII